MRDKYLPNLFGAQWEDNVGGLTVGVSLYAACLWWWRVSRSGFAYNFSNLDGSIGDAFELPKQYPTDGSTVVSSEDELVTINPLFINAPYWIEKRNPNPPFETTMGIGLCRGRTLPIDLPGDLWAMGFNAQCNGREEQPRPFSVSSTPGPNVAGTYRLEAVDPILGTDYTVEGFMYSETPGISGQLRVFPVEWYTYDGLYSPTTGALA